MRSYPEDKWDMQELERLHAQDWMVEALRLNPGYTSWGPDEDYMISKPGDTSWRSSKRFETWDEFGPWELDELNECVNFYFYVARSSKKCPTCGGAGVHPDGQWISESFYRHSSPFTVPTLQEHRVRAIMEGFGSDFDTQVVERGSYPSEELLEKYGQAFRDFCEEMREHGHWNDRITEDEFLALVAANRNWGHKSAEEVNAAQDGPGHDCLNRGILIEARCKRLGVPYSCDQCEGHTYVYTEPNAHLGLVLWWLHPRKGASRGIEIKNIKQEEMSAVIAYLRGAAMRNAERFAAVFDRR